MANPTTTEEDETLNMKLIKNIKYKRRCTMN